ncbi:MAG: inositol monophosphatase [Chloroflexi bacterium]|nr:MAG: inositol monophosphatase [Chloroflexota bacterium]
MTQNPHDLNQLSLELGDIAKTAAFSVGSLLTDAFHNGVSASEKAGFYDLVTEYDRRSEQIITDTILRLYPDSTIVGEEGGASGSGTVRWYVDPIDGTTNFATGFPFFCVSVGAEVAGQIVAGVVFDPLRQEMFRATLNGAYLNDRPIQARRTATESKAVLLTDLPVPGVDTNPETHRLFGEMTQRFRSVRRMGAAALELAYVACGRADVALASIISPWDVAAGYLLVTQAGGCYVPLGGNSAPWLCPAYIAHSPAFKLDESILYQFVKQAQR